MLLLNLLGKKETLVCQEWWVGVLSISPMSAIFANIESMFVVARWVPGSFMINKRIWAIVRRCCRILPAIIIYNWCWHLSLFVGHQICVINKSTGIKRKHCVPGMMSRGYWIYRQWPPFSQIFNFCELKKLCLLNIWHYQFSWEIYFREFGLAKWNTTRNKVLPKYCSYYLLISWRSNWWLQNSNL